MSRQEEQSREPLAQSVAPRAQLSGRGTPPVPSSAEFDSIEGLLRGGWIATASLNLEHLSYILADARALQGKLAEEHSAHAKEAAAISTRMRAFRVQHERLLQELRQAVDPSAEFEKFNESPLYCYDLGDLGAQTRAPSLQDRLARARRESPKPVRKSGSIPRVNPLTHTQSLPERSHVRFSRSSSGTFSAIRERFSRAQEKK